MAKAAYFGNQVHRHMVVRRCLLMYELGWHGYHSARGWYNITGRGVDAFEVSNESVIDGGNPGFVIDTWVPFWFRRYFSCRGNQGQLDLVTRCMISQWTLSFIELVQIYPGNNLSRDPGF